MWLEARIVGVMKFEDDGEVDDKIVVVPADNRDQGDLLKSLDDDPMLRQKLEHHFTHYKDLKNLAPLKLWAGVMQRKLSKSLSPALSATKSRSQRLPVAAAAIAIARNNDTYL